MHRLRRQTHSGATRHSQGLPRNKQRKESEGPPHQIKDGLDEGPITAQEAETPGSLQLKGRTGTAVPPQAGSKREGGVLTHGIHRVGCSRLVAPLPLT